MKENHSRETCYQTKPKSRFLLFLKYLSFQDQVDKYGPLAIQTLFSPITFFRVSVVSDLLSSDLQP